MDTRANSPQSIDEYIAIYPPQIQKLLQNLRQVIQKTVPKAQEAIKYQIPTFTFHGNLLHFGAYKSHIGLYPAPSGIQTFKQELAPYVTGKGTIQFPLDKDLPIELIIKIVKFRVNENLEKQYLKKSKKKI